MKVRKRMGLPKTRIVYHGATGDGPNGSIPADIVEMLRDQARRTIVREQQLAAKQRRLLELAAGPQIDAGESTVVKLAERITSRADYFTPAMKEMAEALGYSAGVPKSERPDDTK